MAITLQDFPKSISIAVIGKFYFDFKYQLFKHFYPILVRLSLN